MAFHDQAYQVLAILIALGEELFCGGLDGLRVRLNFNLSNGFHSHRHALFGVKILLRGDVERHQFQRKFAAVLDHGEDDRAPAFDDPRAAEAIDDERLVRACLAEQAREDADEEHKGERHERHHDDNLKRVHTFSF